MPRQNYDDDWYEYRPRIKADGIKAKSQRGDFGDSWWAKRWIKALERFGYGSRLTRGKSYARGGAVLNIDLKPGQVAAKVQGSRPTPYKVTIAISPLKDEQWERVIDEMATQAIFAAKLLVGEMPQEIEEAFTAAKVHLFPESSRDLATTCSCPDAANPCKHIAAVYYLLGERFDEDPFLIFALRGRSKDQIIDALRARRATAVGDAGADAAPPVELAPPLSELLATYDELGADFESIAVQIAAPALEAAILRRYGSPPAAVESDLRTVYTGLTKAVLERLFAKE